MNHKVLEATVALEDVREVLLSILRRRKQARDPIELARDRILAFRSGQG